MITSTVGEEPAADGELLSPEPGPPEPEGESEPEGEPKAEPEPEAGTVTESGCGDAPPELSPWPVVVGDCKWGAAGLGSEPDA